MSFDERLFLFLNFDGGPLLDTLMLAASGVWMWVWFYALICYCVWWQGTSGCGTLRFRRSRQARPWVGWRQLGFFLCALAVAMALSDMICGVFKHVGLLADLWSSFPARPRPMWSSLPEPVHVLTRGGQYGTVSAHAATSAALVTLSALTLRRTWCTVLGIAVFLLICYSRIYLAYHFPLDIVLGAATGTCCGAAMWWIYRKFTNFVSKRTSR